MWFASDFATEDPRPHARASRCSRARCAADSPGPRIACFAWLSYSQGHTNTAIGLDGPTVPAPARIKGRASDGSRPRGCRHEQDAFRGSAAPLLLEPLMADARFAVHFVEAKAAVALMPVQFTVEEHADLRMVFEVYATYALGTQEFNSLETH